MLDHFLRDGIGVYASGQWSEDFHLGLIPFVRSNSLPDPGEDQVEEAGQSEVERVDPLPRTRPVDVVPVLGGETEESDDGSVGKPDHSPIM